MTARKDQSNPHLALKDHEKAIEYHKNKTFLFHLGLFCSCFYANKNKNNNKASFRNFERSTRSKNVSIKWRIWLIIMQADLQQGELCFV